MPAAATPIGIVRASLLGLAALSASLSGCATRDVFAPRARPTPFAEVPYATWTEQEAAYRIYQGDTLDVAFGSAPELNRTVTVQPDGRITLPLVPPTMAADRNVTELQANLAQAYASTLRRPAVEVNVKTATPLKIFVGGEVDKSGVYDMPGDINALQAVMMAGGFRSGARRSQVVILRRGPGGRAMMRTVDLSTNVFDPANGTGSVPLRRFDIVFVPRTRLSEVADFVSTLRNASPIQFSYAINGYANGGT